MAVFREAEVLQKRLQPRYSQLYGLGGFQYCSLLLDMAEPEGDPIRYLVEVENRDIVGEIWGRSEFALGIAERDGAHLDVALAQLSLGRATLKLTITSRVGIEGYKLAEEHFDTAMEALRHSGQADELVGGFLSRATFRRISGGPEGAAADLQEAQEIAERGSMRLHEADAHLEWTRLHLATGDRDGARRHFDRARELVQVCGYGRREREVAWLEGRLGGAS